MAAKKKASNQREILVYAHWESMTEPQLMGSLFIAPSRGKEMFSFAYEKAWLAGSFAQVLDPSLSLFAGPQYAPEGHDNFGLFLDSSPDRWGRLLMRRREGQLARAGEREARTLKESDYLLGVHDGNRMGALRFKEIADGPFLHDDRVLAAPPWTSLRELEYASLQLEKEGIENDKDYNKWLNLLVAPGGSLGGARPKASVVDDQGNLWIAKFPSSNDDIDMGAWEFLVYQLAERAGVSVSPSEKRTFNSKYHTYLTKRFDRHLGKRIHFSSAMTMLKKTDGDDASKGVSYLDLAEFLTSNGAQTNRDLEQLWRRIVFYICVSNTDDHLRNHGFILTSKGWILSPAFDINPSETGDGLKLNISMNDNAQDFELAMEVASYFRLKPDHAKKILDEVVQAVKGWRTLAKELGLSVSETKRMEHAFRLVRG